MRHQQQRSLQSDEQSQLEQELFMRSERITKKDEEKVLKNTEGSVKRAEKRISGSQSSLKFIDDVKILLAILRDSSFKISWKAKSIIIAGLLYFISPFDLLPDYIPFLGYIDDAFVISSVVNAVMQEIERYKAKK